MLALASRRTGFRSLSAVRHMSVKVGPTGAFLDNEFVPAEGGRTFQTVNPATEEVIAEVAYCSQADVDRAVASSRACLESGALSNGYARSQMLWNLANLIEQNAEELANLEVADNGKPKGEVLFADIPLTVQCYRYYAGLADKISGKAFSADGPLAHGLLGGNTHAYTRMEPVGVVGSIIPWNFPMLMQAWKLAPAIACGAPVVLKTAQQTPLSALRVAELAVQAGFPKGALNVVPGEDDVGALLSNHQDIDKVAFTGSTEVGLKIIQASASTNMKRVSLELGGKSPIIVCDDASIEQAVAQTQLGLFFNQGQVCNASSRVLVDARRYDEFVERSAEATEKRLANVGDGMAEGTAQGPQVSREQCEKVKSFIDSGKKEGATLLVGGSEAFTERGYFVKPTLFADVQDDMKICREEIFGPVMSVFKYDDLDEAIARANNSVYGLAAGVMTNDYSKGHYVANRLKAGTVWVNAYHVFDSGMPFGGFKQSGWGRDLSEYAISNYLETKAVMWNTNPLSK